MLTDHEIMRSVREGNIDQLGCLFEKYNKKLYTYFLHSTRNKHASEDMVQEVFYRLLKYRHTYCGDGDFTVWLYTIARNVRTNYFREHNIQLDALVNDENFIDAQPNPEEEYEHKTDIALLRQALSQLPDDKRELILLSRFNNLRYREIGKILGCSAGTVKVRMYRAIKELADTYYKLTGGNGHEL